MDAENKRLLRNLGRFELLMRVLVWGQLFLVPIVVLILAIHLGDSEDLYEMLKVLLACEFALIALVWFLFLTLHVDCFGAVSFVIPRERARSCFRAERALFVDRFSYVGFVRGFAFGGGIFKVSLSENHLVISFMTSCLGMCCRCIHIREIESVTVGKFEFLGSYRAIEIRFKRKDESAAVYILKRNEAHWVRALHQVGLEVRESAET
jgi:hypothetical protein